MVRTQIESTYTDTCSIWEEKKVIQPNGTTAFEPTETKTNIPCRLSYKSINSTGMTNNAQAVQTAITLFINPDIIIQPGSKLVITRNGRTKEYGYSGEPAQYDTHQEFILNSFEGYS